jgi:hypothetical protein
MLNTKNTLKHPIRFTSNKLISSLEIFASVVRGEMAVFYPVDVPLTADNSSAVTLIGIQRALNSREINRNNKRTTFTSVLIFTD